MTSQIVFKSENGDFCTKIDADVATKIPYIKALLESDSSVETIQWKNSNVDWVVWVNLVFPWILEEDMTMDRLNTLLAERSRINWTPWIHVVYKELQTENSEPSDATEQIKTPKTRVVIGSRFIKPPMVRQTFKTLMFLGLDHTSLWNAIANEYTKRVHRLCRDQEDRRNLMIDELKMDIPFKVRTLDPVVTFIDLWTWGPNDEHIPTTQQEIGPDEEWNVSKIECPTCGLNDSECTYIHRDTLSPPDPCLRTECCRIPVCPMCYVYDPKTQTIQGTLMLMKDCIFLEAYFTLFNVADTNEKDPTEIVTTAAGEPNCQYNALLLEKIDRSQLDKHEQVLENFDDFIVHPYIDIIEETGSYGCDVVIRCECFKCGYECTMRNYLDS